MEYVEETMGKKIIINNKIGFVCTIHQSDAHRPNGFELFNNFVESLYQSCEYPFMLYVFDNGSTDEIENDVDNMKIIRVDDQYARGVTGTWNDGIKLGLADGCDVMIITEDDEIIDNSINNLISVVLSHPLNDNAMYGPVSNAPNNGHQSASEPTGKIFEIDGTPTKELNGFCMAMTRKTIEANYYDTDNFFSTDFENAWGGQDVEVQSRVGHSIVVGTCYVHHIKQGGWRKIRDGNYEK